MTSRDRPAAWAAFIWPGGHNHAAWRLNDSIGDRLMDIEVYKRAALAAERAKFDALFLGDRLGPWPIPTEVLARTSRAARLETITTIAALAMVTERIGLVGTASTSFNEPYNIARQFGTIDHISGGRVGWNIVTSYSDDQAQNYGQEHLPPREERYGRAEEFVSLAKQLWDTFEDDAVVRDKATGQFFRADGFHATDFSGEYIRSKGALNLERPPQGYPVLAQAGASAEGIAFAARHGELVFGASSNMDRSKEFAQKLRAAAANEGRSPDDIRMLASFTRVFGRTRAEAEDKLGRLLELLEGDVARTFAENQMGLDLSRHDLDGPIPELTTVEIPNGMPSGSAKYVLDHARDKGLTLRQFVNDFVSTLVLPRSVQEAADEFEEWYEAEACDGFMIQFDYVPDAVEEFAEFVAPELRRRGLLRSEYTGATLRDHLGIARPRNARALSGLRGARL